MLERFMGDGDDMIRRVVIDNKRRAGQWEAQGKKSGRNREEERMTLRQREKDWREGD